MDKDNPKTPLPAYFRQRIIIDSTNVHIVNICARLAGVFVTVLGVTLAFDLGGITGHLDIDTDLDPPPHQVIGGFFTVVGLIFFFALPAFWRRHFQSDKDKAL